MIQRSRLLWPMALLCLCLPLAGCGKTPPEIVEVEGRVLLNGEPLPNALVEFVHLTLPTHRT